jgi:TRAP-type C4-dicarboxylate transport system substrate-binding protein
MKKELFVGLFLALLLTAAFVNIHYLNKLTDDIMGRVDAAITSAEEEKWDEAEKKTEEAISMWLGSDTYTHLVLRHSELEAATDALYEFAGQVYARDSGAAKGAGQLASARLNSISDIERVRLGSIF